MSDIRVIGIATHTETKEKHVVYEDLKLNKTIIMCYNDFKNTHSITIGFDYKLTSKETKVLYRHFKDKWYKLVSKAQSPSGEHFAIYITLYGDCSMHARPLGMFFSKVDKVKYPKCAYDYRFTSKDELMVLFGETTVRDMMKKEIPKGCY